MEYSALRGTAISMANGGRNKNAQTRRPRPSHRRSEDDVEISRETPVPFPEERPVGRIVCVAVRGFGVEVVCPIEGADREPDCILAT
jgi:hypothetical protein